ncbi:MAG: guanylate kinase [Myxococcota bacterium]|nr:guanylate kinase [Myxococcota bacterium]
MSDSGLLLVMTGPSGVGKSSLVRRVQQELPEVSFSVSCTTRSMRPGEREGIDYFFVEEKEFRRRLEAGEFLEHATVHGNLYGTILSHVMERVGEGAVLLLDIDVQGAVQVRAAEVDAFYLFVLPPSFAELEARLRGRGTDSEEVITRRLSVARSEMDQADLFDHQLVNDDLDRASRELVTVIQERRSKAVE